MTSTERMLDNFESAHLPSELRQVSRRFGELAELLTESLPTDDPELLVGLRKLLEAKDCCVRVKVAQMKRESQCL